MSEIPISEIDRLERELAQVRSYAELASDLLRECRVQLDSRNIDPALRAEISAALAKNPNPSGHPVTRGFANQTGEASGPVGLGPRALPSQSSESRFFMDHGMIHDRVTGQHVHTMHDVEPGGTERLFALLQELEERGRFRTAIFDTDHSS